MDLVVVESGAKAKTIQKYLGKNILVRASNGHIQDLPNKGKDGSKALWSHTESNLPDPPWSWTERAERNVKKILSDARSKKVKRVLIATDPDREGEFIAWRLSELFSEFKEIKRITFNEITKTAIREALDEAGTVDMNLVDAAKVRRFMDRLIGYRTSRFARSWGLSSMGRVQTPALAFVVNKEKDIQKFVATPYWAVQALASGIDFRVRFHDKDDSLVWKDEKGKIDIHRTNSTELANKAYDSLKFEKQLLVSKLSLNNYKRRPKAPFTTDTLLQAAGSKYNWRPSNTMRVAQGLYEAGHITYMRTDSTRTSSSSREKAQEKITSKWGKDLVGKGVGGGKPKSGIQDAHEAIRPTAPLTELPGGLDESQVRLYRLIWSRFIASQMIDSEWTSMKLQTQLETFERPLDGDTKWRVTSGWESAFEAIQKAPAVAPPKPEIVEGQSIKLDANEDNPRFIEDKTKPPARYTQHGLVALMKSEGIGRPSTYAATIKKLLDRKYCSDNKGRLKPTDQGILLCDEVIPFYESKDEKISLFSPSFTSTMEVELDQIETGQQNGATVWDGFVNSFKLLHEKAISKKKETPTKRQLDYYIRLASLVSDSELEKVIGKEDPQTMSGERIGEVIDSLQKETEDIPLPASAKQLSYAQSLAESLELNEKSACNLVDVSKFEELSGGKAGTASQLIGLLRDKTDSVPKAPSPKQINFIKNLATKAKLEEADACNLVNVANYGELSGGRQGTASKLIETLRKKSPKKS
ncbi:MAG: type I DNA topoisomerase [Methanobacteriota archaeon]|jgi:DNA topoisomerase-1|nr:MAG: type I DNA topoisomerase [Euryarchaeota archaeon]